MEKVVDILRQKWENFSIRQKIGLFVFGMIVVFVLIAVGVNALTDLINKDGQKVEQVEVKPIDLEESLDHSAPIPTFRIPDDATDEEVDSLLMEFYDKI